MHLVVILVVIGVEIGEKHPLDVPQSTDPSVVLCLLRMSTPYTLSRSRYPNNSLPVRIPSHVSERQTRYGSAASLLARCVSI